MEDTITRCADCNIGCEFGILASLLLPDSLLRAYESRDKTAIVPLEPFLWV
jgi:hypothetical protein